MIGVAAPPGPRESLRTVAAVPFTATISVTVSPVRTSPIGSVASVPGPVKCSCAAPAGTPVSVKRPLGSAVVVRLVPTTLIVLTGVARLEARPLPEGPAVALPETCPVIVAPAVAVGGVGVTAGEVGSVGDDPPPHATRLTEATNVSRSLRLRIRIAPSDGPSHYQQQPFHGVGACGTVPDGAGSSQRTSRNLSPDATGV